MKILKLYAFEATREDAVSDGVYKEITETYSGYNIMSALILREFLYSL